MDLNHWIGLAKANIGHPDGARYKDALAAMRQTKAAGSVIFPLSGTHYMELAGIGGARQRPTSRTSWKSFRFRQSAHTVGSHAARDRCRRRRDRRSARSPV
jgi:hypothetical protein